MSAEYGEDYPYLLECQKNWKKLTYRAWWFTRALLEVHTKIDLPKNSLILSVGSGIGQLEHFLNTGFDYKVICLDINYSSLQARHKLMEDNNSLVADSVFLPFPNQTFDLVLSYDLMEHLPDESAVDTAFAEMERVIKGESNIQMLHKITVCEEREAIDADKTHRPKWSAEQWCLWFKKRGWETREPTQHKIPIWSRRQIGLYPVMGAFYLGKNNNSSTQ